MKATYFDVAPGVWGSKDIFVNFYFVQDEASKHWVLVDTGLSNAVKSIKKIATELFGPDSRPEAIILTHGHSDHSGSVKQLAHDWHVPVYAHYLELPYLTGHSAYPPADPTVGGGFMTRLSVLFPRGPLNLEGAINALPDDGSVPGLPGWKWEHTPGHAPGHISLFREKDRVLIAGDAFITTRGESLRATIKQVQLVSGPPKYFTPDWEAAEASVKKLADLNPEVAATGHGRPMQGKELQEQLRMLADNFELLAVPPEGRYIDEPALADATGVLYVPPKLQQPMDRKKVAIGVSLAVLAGAVAFWAIRQHKKKKWYQLA